MPMNEFTALADPTRRAIIDLLSNGEMDAGTIADHFAISQPAVSRHLKTLLESGLVVRRKEAQRRVYSLDASGLREVDRWLSKHRVLWSQRLDKFEKELEKETR